MSRSGRRIVFGRFADLPSKFLAGPRIQMSRLSPDAAAQDSKYFTIIVYGWLGFAEELFTGAKCAWHLPLCVWATRSPELRARA
jgi:hypothetical protein